MNLELLQRAISSLEDYKDGAEWASYDRETLALLEAAASAPTPSAQPIDMVLHCPACGLQHIDAPDTEPSAHSDGRESMWDNPPHRSHLCGRCGHIWRPADMATNGVAAIKTKGKADSPAASPAPVTQPEPAHWIVPDFGFLFPSRDAARRYLENIGSTASPTPLAPVAQPRDDGMPASADERHLRRLLARRVALPGAYYDDGEAQGQEHGISIDFMREPVADIDAKIRALNVARFECAAHGITGDAS